MRLWRDAPREPMRSIATQMLRKSGNAALADGVERLRATKHRSLELALLEVLTANDEAQLERVIRKLHADDYSILDIARMTHRTVAEIRMVVGMGRTSIV